MERRQVWNLVAFGLSLVSAVLVIAGMLLRVGHSAYSTGLLYAGGAGITVCLAIYMVMAFSSK